MKYTPIYEVKCVRCGNVPHYGEIRFPADIAELFYKYFEGIDREKVVVLLLNSAHRVIGVNTVSVGTIDKSPVHPREVFKPAIIQGCASVILAHNHPSGEISPSREDREVTEKIRAAGDILGIKLLDHIIVGYDKDGQNAYYSCLEN